MEFRFDVVWPSCLFTSEDKGEAVNVAAESWPLALFDEEKGLFD